MQRNTLNLVFITLRHEEQMILSSRMYEKTYLQGSLEGVLKAIKVSRLSQYSHDFWMLGYPLQSSSLREKDKKGENSHKARMGT